MIREFMPDASFELFNVNSWGGGDQSFGLTRATIERANREADLVVVGGSNLYEGNYRRDWGVHLEPSALDELRVPLFLLGIGTGSAFLSPLHKPSPRALKEIRLLNERADFSGARDIVTLRWLRALGVSKAELTGDPATFIFNRPATFSGDRVIIVLPPRRFWSNVSHYLKTRRYGRPMFHALTSLARSLAAEGREVLVICNDPADLSLAQTLFGAQFNARLMCPQTPEQYFNLLAESRAVVTGRLHAAVVAFSLGIPFVIIDADYRSRGFVETYELNDWAVTPARDDFEARLFERAGRLFEDGASVDWEALVQKRERMYEQGMSLLREAFGSRR